MDKYELMRLSEFMDDDGPDYDDFLREAPEKDAEKFRRKYKEFYSDVKLDSGSGYFACGGKIIPITWEKGGHYDQLRYYTSDGKPLTLGVGKSFVCIIPSTQCVRAE